MDILFSACILASMVLYTNTISILKKIKNNEDYSGNALLGFMLTGFITYSIITLVTH